MDTRFYKYSKGKNVNRILLQQAHIAYTPWGVPWGGLNQWMITKDRFGNDNGSVFNGTEYELQEYYKRKYKMINKDDIEAFDEFDDPASRPREERVQEVTGRMAELFYGQPSVQDLVEAMESVAVNQLDLKDLYLVANDVYAFIDRERNK